MFDLSDDHEDFRAVVRDFAEEQVAPHCAAWDVAGRLPVDLVHRMGDLGLFGLTVPEEHGGAGADLTTLCVAIEELGRVDQSVGITLSAAVGLGINPILTFGDREQRERWLPDLVTGRALAAFGLTEPDSGSDAAALRTRARRIDDGGGADGDGGDGGWVLDGSKAFITNSGHELTSVITVAARSGQDDGGRPRISTFLVPAGTEGLTVEPAYRKLGWHASDTHPLTLAGCRVGPEALLGEEGAGFRQFLATLDDGRVAIAALALGLARACLETATEYAGQRVAFGRAIGANQGVAFPLADLATAVEAGRLLTYRAAALADRCRAGGGAGAGMRAEAKRAAAMAKLQSTGTAVDATRLAAQVLGGASFVEDSPVARFYRDAKVLEIGEGTSQVQRLVIARGLGLAVD